MAACLRCRAADGVRLYAVGPRCPDCTPAALADPRRLEPGQGAYCPPRICWCGTCPWAGDVVAAPPSRTAIDVRHELSGKRFTTPREYAAVRLNSQEVSG